MRTTISTLLVSMLSAHAVAAQHAMPAASAAGAEAPAAAQPAGASAGVARAQFTSAIQDREPIDNLTALAAAVDRVFFFTELAGLSGQRVTHRWELDDNTVAEVGFDVGADRWRVWSSKLLDPAAGGEWKVSVLDASGATLATQALSQSPAKPN
jgi:hypothetical protein